MHLADVAFELNLFETHGVETKRKEFEVSIMNPHNHPVKWLKDGVEIVPVEGR